MYSHIIVVEESWDIACISTSGYDNLALYSPFIYPPNFYSQPLWGGRGTHLIQSAISAVLVSTSNLLLLNFAIVMIVPFSCRHCRCLGAIGVLRVLVSSHPISQFDRVSVDRLDLD